MCGITGYWQFEKGIIEPRRLEAMTNTLRHRGPDDEGYVVFDTETGQHANFHGSDTTAEARRDTQHIRTASFGNLAFGFRRLSIVDLTAHGHQPMSDITGRFHIVFNGEIYNYKSLRKELEASGHRFQSNTDTEVILYAYRQWGEDCLYRFNGMWAFAIYDREARSLFLSRDRYGVKPLYYVCTNEQSFLFASEMKALLTAGHPYRPNADALFDYFYREMSDHNENTFFEGIHQLEPGMKLKVSSDGKLKLQKWYQLPHCEIDISFEDACTQFSSLLEDAIDLRQKCDVPFGYTLSGGIDSSAIVCTAAHRRDISSDITFTLVFPGKPEDETDYVDEVIRETGFKSNTITAEPNDLERDLDRFVYHQEEPFGLISYYGEYRLRELIRQSGITVSLEGQGADEIITGYRSLLPAYFESLVRDRRFLKLREETKRFAHLGSFSARLAITGTLTKLLRNRKETVQWDRYPLINGEALITDRTRLQWKSTYGLEDRMIEMLTKSSIPEQLNRADKSSMAFSTESRFPFLDYRLVEFCMSLPYDHKISQGVTKRILRSSLKEWLPEKIYHRKDKIGFAVPVRNWVNDALHQRILEKTTESRLPFIDKDAFLSAYSDKDKIDWAYWKIASVALWDGAFNRPADPLP